MNWDDGQRPRLRPLEAFPLEGAQEGMIGLRDRSNIVPEVLMVSEPVFFVLSLCDGLHTLTDMHAAFAARYGLAIPDEKLPEILSGISQAHLLDDDAFAEFYDGLVAEYHAAPARTMRSAQALGIDGDIGRMFDDLLASGGVDPRRRERAAGLIHAVDRRDKLTTASRQSIWRPGGSPPFDGAADPSVGEGRLVGLIAPHLDYPRGAPCYATAYAQLRRREPPDRIVILGTNHFGRAAAVVATGKDFETPLGRTATDIAFIESLEARCGDLRREEFDHQREHSVELQVLWCQHLFGADRFKIVPILCPDPCGPTGTRPYDGEGIDLGEFAKALGECIREDPADTLVIAGADLSHVGAHFGDDRPFDEEFLQAVWERDKRALQALEEHGAEAFRTCVAEDENPTRVCSAGCVFVLKAALHEAKARILRYHQAVDQATRCGVTCAAVAVLE